MLIKFSKIKRLIFHSRSKKTNRKKSRKFVKKKTIKWTKYLQKSNNDFFFVFL